MTTKHYRVVHLNNDEMNVDTYDGESIAQVKEYAKSIYPDTEIIKVIETENPSRSIWGSGIW